MKPKPEIMQKLRKDRAAQGLKRCEFWLTQEQKELVKKYVRYLGDVENGCYCERKNVGVIGVSCGDCPRDYAAKQLL